MSLYKTINGTFDTGESTRVLVMQTLGLEDLPKPRRSWVHGANERLRVIGAACEDHLPEELPDGQHVQVHARLSFEFLDLDQLFEANDDVVRCLARLLTSDSGDLVFADGSGLLRLARVAGDVRVYVHHQSGDMWNEDRLRMLPAYRVVSTFSATLGTEGGRSSG